MENVGSHFDVIVIGGGTAGLSAALVLGRARRRVLVLNEGPPRNAPADAAHGMFSRDGTPPLELLRIAREQLRPYTTVEVRDVGATSVAGADGDFRITLKDSAEVSARKVVLATGMTDELPETEGFRELWGAGVFHCPYCHGWEVRDEPLAIYGGGPGALDYVVLLKGWSDDIVLCTDGPSGLSEEELRVLDSIGVPVREERIARLEGDSGHLQSVVFEGGERLERRGIFVRTKQHQRSDLAARLGCEVDGAGFIRTDLLGRTSVPGVFAAGDIVGQPQSVILAAGRGASAGYGINHDLAHEDVYRPLAV